MPQLYPRPQDTVGFGSRMITKQFWIVVACHAKPRLGPAEDVLAVSLQTSSKHDSHEVSNVSVLLRWFYVSQ